MTTATSIRSTPKKKSAPKAAPAAPLIDAQSDGVATANDVALAASLPATARALDPAVSLGLINLLRDSDLVSSLRANASAIDAEGRGTVEDILSRIPDFVVRYDALVRLNISAGRVRDSLTRDNADFGNFATAIANVFTKAGPLSPVKKDKALKKLAKNRSIQRGLPKRAKTMKRKARAKKKAVAAKGA